ncbi:hypothetical protein X777_01276 [Ooceraea biroi]|uniref:Uncharacterized protein n=1 Tax=Ooceraea biroi TaxID=2015173 RepID=A0A026WT86_OOCBI|nr:hypothetical protein X777_01276 [Ooceraea biroi]
MKSNDVVAILHKGGNLHIAICIYCSPHAFAFSYGSLCTRGKTANSVTRSSLITHARSLCRCTSASAIDDLAGDQPFLFSRTTLSFDG